MIRRKRTPQKRDFTTTLSATLATVAWTPEDSVLSPAQTHEDDLNTSAANSLSAPENAVSASSKKPRRWLRRFLWVLATLLLIIIAGASYIYYEGQQLVYEFQAGNKRAIVEAALPQLAIIPPHQLPALKGSTTFLLIGSDIRYGSGGNGNSDTMILANINPTRNTVSLLSLPRDLYVDIPGHGMAKLNAAYALGGPALLIATIRDFTGVRINHFIDIDFGGFDKLVDSLGGVYLPIDGRYFHISEPAPSEDWSSINLQPGYQLLGGANALQWVRFRHEDSDFYRVARQQIFLREVARQVRAQITDIGRISGILHALADASASDIHSFTYLLSLAITLHGIPASHVTRVTMNAGDLILNGVDYLQATDAEKQQALNAWADPEADIGLQNIPSKTPPAPVSKPHTTSPTKKIQQPASPSYTGLLVSDDGSGQTLLAPYSKYLRVCAPTALPSGYNWGALSPAREYELDGHPAVAAWASEESGVSVLWMWSTWTQAPILSSPSETITRGGHSYQLYYDSGRLRQVAWSVGKTEVWVTNTLLNALSDSQMIALATSCQPL